MHVLGIDEATADALLHIDEVELDDTRDGSPVLFVEAVAGTLLGGQLQIDTRGQRHLVIAVTVVTGLVFGVGLFPFVERVAGIAIVIGSAIYRNVWLIGLCIGVVGGTHTCIEANVAGQCAEVVHNVVDAEVVAVKGSIAGIGRND